MRRDRRSLHGNGALGAHDGVAEDHGHVGSAQSTENARCFEQLAMLTERDERVTHHAQACCLR